MPKTYRDTRTPPKSQWEICQASRPERSATDWALKHSLNSATTDVVQACHMYTVSAGLVDVQPCSLGFGSSAFFLFSIHRNSRDHLPSENNCHLVLPQYAYYTEATPTNQPTAIGQPTFKRGSYNHYRKYAIFFTSGGDDDQGCVRFRRSVRFVNHTRSTGYAPGVCEHNPVGPRKLERSMPIQYLRRSTIAQQYRSELAQQLSTCTGSASVDEAWQNVKEAMLAAFSAVCPTSPIRPQNHWISARSLSMIDARKSIQRTIDSGAFTQLAPPMRSYLPHLLKSSADKTVAATTTVRQVHGFLQLMMMMMTAPIPFIL
ncbi:hypothetical protein CLF_103230 [Clonorchis sinensis]|uniref:ATP-binding cassette transporter n=1 Tax=Clonorchis sinensis TaxID=79923 RepID=G7Y9C6_CLOSI|nr:hypothetical protein CLF_103230 [Clonorchis sinensis]